MKRISIIIFLLMTLVGCATQTKNITLYQSDKNKSIGLEIINYNNEVIISRVLSNRSADFAGLRRGDVIEQMDGKNIYSVVDVVNKVQSKDVGDVIQFSVYRDKGQIKIPVIVGNPVDLAEKYTDLGIEGESKVRVNKVADELAKKKEEAVKKRENELIAKYKSDIDTFIKSEDYSGLKKYVNINPKASYFIPDYKLRLLFIGPAKLQIGDLIKYKKKKMSDVLLSAKIESSKVPYKIFTMEEIEILQEYKISDTLIASMLKVTTKIEDQMAQDAKQKQYLEEQRAFMANVQNNTAQKNQSTSSNVNGGSAANDVAKELATAAGKEVGKEVFKSILSNLF